MNNNPNKSGTKRSLVIGGSTGVGRGVADALLESGFEVHVVSRNEPEKHNSSLLWHQCDLLDTENSKNVLRSIADAGLDFACFSATYYGPKRCTFLETPWEVWNEQATIMIDGLWASLSLVIPALQLSDLGIFLGISSEVAFNHGPGRAGYATCKSAAAGLLGSIAKEIDPVNVLVVQALPVGMVDSPGIRARRPSDFDYSAYMKPDDFKPFVKDLVISRDISLHGETVAIDGSGKWQSVDPQNLPPSQSR